MAATTLKPTINIKSSFTTISAGFTKANKSVGSMKNVLLKKTKVKRDAIAGRKSLFGKRIENQRRKDEEAVIEASKPNTISKIGNSVLNSGKGLLDRIIDFAGTLLVGWLVNNLPTIMTMAQDLIGRIQRTVSILGNFMRDIGAIFTGSTKVFGAVLTNIKTLDFFDSNKRLDKALGEFESVFDDMNKQFDDGLKTLTTPLGQMPGEAPVPPTGTDYTMPPEQVGRGGGGGGGGKWKPLLDLISSGEGGYTSIAPGDQNPNLTKMTIAEANRSVGVRGGKGAIGRYQFTTPISQAKRAGLDPNKDLFSPQNQDKMAVNLIMERGGGSWISGKISDEQFSESLAHEWGSFRSASGYVLPNNSGAIGFNKLKPVLKKVKGGGGDAQIAPAVTTNVQDQFKGNPGGSVGASSNSLAKAAESLKGFSTKSGPGGGNIACVWAVNQVFRKAGITPPWGTSDYVPTAEQSMIKSGYQRIPKGKQMPGDLYIVAGQAHIGIVLPNGNIISNSSSGAKFSWEASLSSYESSYHGEGRFYRMPGAQIAGNFNAPLPQNANFISTANQANLPSTRRAPQVMVMDNRPAPQPQQRQVASGGGAPPPMIDSENVLNNLMRNYLLLDLAYT